MPRRRVELPTKIYWLFDMRPETIAAGWHSGFPFYCGKTVYCVLKRLKEHRTEANRKPERAISKWLRDCGPDVRFQIMEVVPPLRDWTLRERHWIELMRFSFPGGANSSDGGEGSPGLIHSALTRARMSKAQKGRRRDERWRARIGAGVRKTNEQRRREREHVPVQVTDVHGSPVTIYMTRWEAEAATRPVVPKKPSKRPSKSALVARMTEGEFRIWKTKRDMLKEARAAAAATPPY